MVDGLRQLLLSLGLGLLGTACSSLGYDDAAVSDGALGGLRLDAGMEATAGVEVGDTAPVSDALSGLPEAEVTPLADTRDITAPPLDIATNLPALDTAGDTVGDTVQETTGDVTVDTASDTASDTAKDSAIDTADTQPDIKPPCNDNNPCTADHLDAGVCHHDYIYGLCCASNAMCEDQNSCTEDVCIDGFCTHEPSCCTVNLDCADADDLCTTDSCASGTCLHTATLAPGCCKPLMLEARFEDGTAGPLFVQNVSAEVGWHVVSGGLSNSPPGAMYYGTDPLGSYDSGTPSKGTLQTAPIALPAGVPSTLRFAVWVDVEPDPSFDVLQVALTSGPGPVVVVWDKSKLAGYQAWQAVAIDLSGWAGKTITLRVNFDTKDDIENSGQGVYLDDLLLDSPCEPRTCTDSKACDDGLSATSDLCIEGQCAYVPETAACATATDCDDGKPCTLNVCQQGKCTYPVLGGCCLSDLECADDKPCTADNCAGLTQSSGGVCQHLDIADCCLTGAT